MCADALVLKAHKDKQDLRAASCCERAFNEPWPWQEEVEPAPEAPDVEP